MKEVISYEKALKLKFNGEVDFYYIDNSAWDKNNPITLISREEAEYRSAETKYTAFVDFDTTVPAPYKSNVN